METKRFNKLPWITLISGIIMVILIAIAFVFKSTRNIENPQNRNITLEELRQISIDNKEDIFSKSFHDYVNNTLNSSIISTKWLISNKGIFLYANGATAASTPVNSSIYSSIDKQSLGLLNAVDENLDSFQKTILYAAAAIRKEGEHNDIYGHIVLPLKTSSNEPAGFIGVSYELDYSDQTFQGYIIISFALLICFLIYWLSLPVWVYFDSRNKNDKYILWTVFVLFGNIPAYIAYLLSKNNK